MPMLPRSLMRAGFAAAAILAPLTADAQQPKTATASKTAITTVPALPKAAAETVGMSTPRLARIGVALKKEIEAGKLPGAVVMVARKGRVVYEGAWGLQDPDAKTPMKMDSIFRIYSMSKPLVSVAAMMLVEDGVVQLTDPVSKFLPELKDVKVSTASGDVAAERQMTVQDLLRHSAGLAYGELTKNAKVKDDLVKAGLANPGKIDYDSRAMSGKEQVERLSKIALIHQPGTVWEYSLASDVLGRVVEAASGKRLGAFLDERMFKPLRMVDSGFWVPAAKMPRLAKSFAKDSASGNSYPLIDVSAEPGNDSGGAGAVSTASDYMRFALMLMNGGTLNGQRVMTRPTIRLMASDHLGTRIAATPTPGELLLGTPGYTFGLGFAVRQGDGIAGIPGSPGEFMWAGYAGTFFWVDPKEQITAVYMTQAPSPIRASYRRLMKQLVYQAIVD